MFGGVGCEERRSRKEEEKHDNQNKLGGNW